uniref:Right handed beta helix domain-containing protein n=1 Tax=Amphimedon queenslandica TaxID=400682 RepID=A0A1X7V2A0_AMPQE
MSFIGIILLFATAVCFFPASGQEKIYYVHPNGDQSGCPLDGSDCYTLNEYFAVFTEEEEEGAIFRLLPGNHYLNNSIDISLSSNVTFHGMTGETNPLDFPVVIRCTAENVTIKFESCNNVQFQNLMVRNCGKRFASKDDFYESALVMLNVSNAKIVCVSIQDGPGAALALIDSLNISISYSSFYFNNRNSTYNESTSVAVFYFTAQAGNNSDTNPMKFEMLRSNITNDKAIGLHIQLIQVKSLLDIRFESIYIANNGFLNILLFSVTDNYDLSITTLRSTASQYGFMVSQNKAQNDLDFSRMPFINITDCFFTGNGIVILWSTSLSGLFYLGHSTFSHNTGIIGSALLIATDRNPTIEGSFDITLHNVTFDSNTLSAELLDYDHRIAATVGVSNGRNLSIINCTFSNNRGSGLGIFNTYATFYGVNNFINNSADIGGGILMISTSYLFFTPGSLVNFTGNHATNKGGAVNVEQVVLLFTAVDYFFSQSDVIINPCFYGLEDKNLAEKHLYFQGNTAEIAGSVLYGGDTGVCTQAGFSEISTFVDQEDTFSIISSDPRGVCFCRKGPDANVITNCSQKTLSMSAVPGGSAKFSVVVIGQDENATTGIISVSINKGEHSVNYSHYTMHLSTKCTDLTQVVQVQHNSTTKVTVNVTIGNFETNFFQHPLTVDVDINPCLTGTYLSPVSHVCECESYIKDASTECNGVNATVTKEGIHGWIGNYKNCNSTVVYYLCPYDYCIQSSVNYSLDDPNKQCALNRSGLLCTQCNEGLSLMLGSNKCGECTNDYLSLIIPFSLAGIALVILIIVLNITVTVGTINGLLFFANVVKIFQPILLGTDNTPVLSQFIAWINLDLGIETCFFDGMNACAKIGLQFVFPFYLWLLILLIIVLSGRFSKLSQLIGNNAVPVLCTLLLLSYTKLLRTVISIFIYPALSTTCFDHLVWYYNGEPYLSSCHLILFLIGLPVLVFLISPYILFLLFFPLWEKCRSKWRFGTKLYLKLKPVFDAYAGPHTDTFRFWPGILLVARVIIAIALVTTTSIRIISISVAVIAILLVTLSFGSVYKNKIIHMLDVCYLMLLLIIFYIIAGTIGDQGHLRTHAITRSGAKIGIIIMLLLGFLGFFCIMAYHVYTFCKLRCGSDKCSGVKKIKNSTSLHNIAAVSSNDDPQAVLESFVDVSNQLREPLLESI